VRYDQKILVVFMYSTRYACPILMKLEFSRQFSKNNQISDFMKIPPVGAELFFHRTDGCMDRHGVVYSRFSQFCECA